MPISRDFSKPPVRKAWAERLSQPISEQDWEALARKLFAWQYARVPAYGRLCRANGQTPATLRSWRDIPAVPQQLFKRAKLFAHGARRPGFTYETSGTTTGQPGRQHLLQSDIYRSVCVKGARQAGLLKEGCPLFFLTPSPQEAPRSSLSAMFGFWAKSQHQEGPSFWVRRGTFVFADLRKALVSHVDAGKPVALCGTAFSFVHLLDAWAGLPKLRLPLGSLLLETGGFKGRSREISKQQLYTQLARMLGISASSIWNEYGMSELSSQAYAHGISGLHSTPPWARVLVVDPATSREVEVGRQGLVRWFDLANVDSVMALQTLDLAERTQRGFRLIGRLPRTEPRGCSLSVEDLAPTHVTLAA